MNKFIDDEISLDDFSYDFEGKEKKDDRVAIIGVSIRTSSGNTEEFWEDIKNGCNLVSEFRNQRMKDIKEYNAVLGREYKYADGAFINDIDKFDYKFFNMTPKEAQLMDPCYRLFLQNTINAIEDAGYGNNRLDNTDTRIYVGYAGNIKDSYINMIWNTNEKDVSMSIVNNMTGMISGRLSHILNTHGTAQIIDATCASSLIAVHEGCESIISGKCSIAIVGSMRINLIPVESETSRIGVESKDYQTRTFDDKASGFGEGDGVVTLILKSFEKAVRDKDNIHAVIKASAVSQGGESMGLTVTNPSALKDTISDVILHADQKIDNIGMYELHGTATNLGDPIEMQGMSDALRLFTQNKAFCAIGSVKSNIGHLYEASGIIGLVKAILSLEHKTIPPTINLTEPNREILFENSPFYINTKARYWKCENGKRAALVNSLGLNGANCCVLVEEYDNEYEKRNSLKQRFLPLSAKSTSSLKKIAQSYIVYLKNNDIDLDDLCYSAAIGRWHFDKRALFQFETVNGLIRMLSEFCENETDKIFFSEIEVTDIESKYEILKKAYMDGKNVSWSEYFDETYRMLHLPVYQFEENRCWIEYDNLSSNFENPSGHIYETVWNKIEIALCNDIIDEVTIIGFDNERVREYEEFYKSNKIKASSLCIDINNITDISIYKNVFITIESSDICDTDTERLKRYLLFFFQLCTNTELERITLVTPPLHVIDGTEKIDKSAAVLSAFLRAIQKEKSDVFVNILETDGKKSALNFWDKLMKKEQLYLAYRSGSYYIPFITNKKIASCQNVFSSGTYLITAGTSIVTHEVCARLAKNYPNSTFVFLSRSLDDFDSTKDGEKYPDSRITRYCHEICKKNGRFIIRKTDICCEEKLSVVIKELENQNIIPDYLVHSASGDLSYEYSETDNDKLSSVLDPKIKALTILDEMIGDKLKGYILFSSMATTFMAPLQSGYIAANAFIDAFCDDKCQQGKIAVSLQWSTWRDIGMAARKGLNYDLIFKAMSNESALSYFDEIIQKGITGNLIIGEFNVSPMGRRLIENSKVRFAEGVIPIDKTVSRNVKTEHKIELKGRSNNAYTATERKISQICRDVLGYKSINIYENFFEMGADSLQIMNLHKQISNEFPGQLEITDMFSYSNVNKLAEYLCDGNNSEDTKNNNGNEGVTDSNNKNDIAIVGIAAKIPGTKNLKEFYESLLRGECFVKELPEWRKRFLTKYYNYTKQELKEESFAESAYLDDIDKFDYEYFNISPREACLMDPHQRLYLELSVEAIEDAGYSTEKMRKSKTGVFLGFGTNIKDMYMRMLADVSSEDIADAIVGNTQCVLAGRISHDLDLKGASMVIDTACSSSIVALNTAIQYIKTGQIDSALVGGIKLMLCPVRNDELYTIGMESNDGFTRTFDQTATGTAFGESAQMIFIKSYEKAICDGDHIYGIIKSTGINQDGNSAGVTAPNPISQQEVILDTWNSAGINPEDLGFIEIHGTATRLGDTIEYKSLNKAFRNYTQKNGICAVTTVKPNFGHMSEGAGLFSLIKGLEILKYGVIPKNILFDQPNNSIDMIDSAIYYNTKNIEWKSENNSKIFAISNFGMSGTNTHLVIQEATPQRNKVITRKRRIVPISNKTKNGFENTIRELLSFISENKIDFHNLCYTLSVGRNHYSYRMAIVCENINELRLALCQYIESCTLAANVYVGCKKVVSNDRVYLADDEIYPDEQNILTEKADNTNNLDKLAELYCQGAILSFEKLFEGEKLFRESLPTYSFTKESCWIKIPEVYNAEDPLYYVLNWKEKYYEGTKSLYDERKRYIVIADTKSYRHNEIINAINKKSDISIIIYDIREILEKYTLVENLQELLSSESINGIDGIIQFMPVNDSVYNTDEYELCLNLFRTAKAIIRLNLMSELKIITLSFNVFKVDGEEKDYQPLCAVGHGINRVISLELSNVSSYAIDSDDETDPSIIADEIFFEKKMNYYVSFRKNKRFVQEIAYKNISVSSKRYNVRSDGVYVITGGTGGIGLFYAKCFAEENTNVNIALITKSDRYKNDDESMKKIHRLRELGAEINIFEADVSDYEKIEKIFVNIKEKYARINGVIHAAGIASAQIMALRKEEDFLNVMSPKYNGTWNVFKQIENENVDFFVLCSSGCTLTGEASQADYVAANSYLDAFTYYANKHNVKTHCINFSSWKSEGMSVRFNINVDTFFKALETEDARKALFEIIGSENERCFVGKINKGYCREQSIDLKSLPFDVSQNIEEALEVSGDVNAIDFIPLKTKNTLQNASTVLKGNDENTLGYTETEKEIAAMISKVLGVETINIYDSFFELGGDSILLGRFHAMIEQKYPSKMKLLDLFEYNSVKKIAEYISNNGTIEQKSDDDDSTKIESETNDQIDKLVERFERGEISIDDMLSEIT